MPVQQKVTRNTAGLASELRMSVMRLRRRLIRERHPDNELSPGSMSVLGALRVHGDLTIGELAGHEQVRPPSMTRTVKHLEEGGYVDRRPHPTDGRQVVIHLSDTGRASVMADRAKRDAWLARQLTKLTPDERAVLREAAPILEKLTTL